LNDRAMTRIVFAAVSMSPATAVLIAENHARSARFEPVGKAVDLADRQGFWRRNRCRLLGSHD
jgi:hypothetical protein